MRVSGCATRNGRYETPYFRSRPARCRKGDEGVRQASCSLIGNEAMSALLHLWLPEEQGHEVAVDDGADGTGGAGDFVEGLDRVRLNSRTIH